MTTDKIPLSELKEWMSHLSILSWLEPMTRRQKLEAAVLCAKGERLEAAGVPYPLDTDPAPAAVPMTDEERSELPW